MKDLIIFIEIIFLIALAVVIALIEGLKAMLRVHDKCLDGESHIENCKHGRKG